MPSTDHLRPSIFGAGQFCDWSQGVHAALKSVPCGKTFYGWVHKHPYSVSITVTAGGTLSGYALGKSHGQASAKDKDCGGTQASTGV